MTTPDQPTGMNELRPILLAVRDWGEGLAKQQFDDDPLPGMSPTDAEAAIRQIVERCIPPVKSRPDSDASRWAEGVHEGHSEAIDQFRHNLQQAGLLRGDDVTKGGGKDAGD